MCREWQRRRWQILPALQQPIVRIDQSTQDLFGHAATKQNSQSVHRTGTADAHARRIRRHQQPGIIIHQHAPTIGVDFLAAVPGADQCHARRRDDIVGYLRMKIENGRIVSAAPMRCVQIATNRFMQITDDHPPTSCSVICAFKMQRATRCIQALYGHLMPARDERFHYELQATACGAKKAMRATPRNHNPAR